MLTLPALLDVPALMLTLAAAMASESLTTTLPCAAMLAYCVVVWPGPRMLSDELLVRFSAW